MSLSNPHEKGQPNPSTRWFEWNGEQGTVSFYDKDLKQTIAVPLPDPRTDACLTDPAFTHAEARLRALLIESHRSGRGAP